MIFSEGPLLPVLSRASGVVLTFGSKTCEPASAPPQLSRAAGYERISTLFVAPAACAESFSASLNRAGTSRRTPACALLECDAGTHTPPGGLAKGDANGEGVAEETLLSDSWMLPRGVGRGLKERRPSCISDGIRCASEGKTFFANGNHSNVTELTFADSIGVNNLFVLNPLNHSFSRDIDGEPGRERCGGLRGQAA